MHSMEPTNVELLLQVKNKHGVRPVNLIIGEDAVTVEGIEDEVHSMQSCIALCRGSESSYQTLKYENILNCTVAQSSTNQVILSFVNSKSKAVDTISGLLSSSNDIERAEKWAVTILTRAYQGVKRGKKLLVLINPFSGSGNGIKIWENIVLPIFIAAGCEVEAIKTQRRFHAIEIGETATLDAFDAVACVSGDGLIHELINGIAKRPDAGAVLRKLNIGAIPAGSGNAISVNVLGPENASNAALGALSVLKGKPISLDICSVTQASPSSGPSSSPPTVTRTLSCLSQAFGLMADLDIGTEHLRWMGGTRFVLGFIQGAVEKRKQRCRLDVLLIDENKDSIARKWQNDRQIARERSRSVIDGADPFMTPKLELHREQEEEDGRTKSDALPELIYGDVTSTLTTTNGQWIAIEEDITSIYAGTVPFVADNLCQFPVKLCGDGSVDIMLHQSPSVKRTLGLLDGSERGSFFRNSDIRYFKAKAFRLTPLPSKKPSFVTIDGENFPYQPIQVEVHTALTNVLSTHSCLGDVGVPDTM